MAPGTPPTDPPEEIFLAQQPLIKKVVEHTCRRYRFRPEEKEDFASTVNTKLIDDDYAIIRKFKGESTLGTFLTTVIKNMAKDYRDHCWGKWRPCAEAVRLGAVAIQLDTLMYRDGHTFDEACEILRTNYKVEESREDLLRIAERLPWRFPRRPPEGEEVLKHWPAQSGNADEQLLARERSEKREKIMGLLDQVLAKQPSDNQILINLRIWRDFSVADIARTLDLDQKSLYRRIDRIKMALREAIEAEGVHREDVEEILGADEP